MPEILPLVAVVAPLVGALLVRVVGDSAPPRVIAVLATLTSLVCSLRPNSLDALSHFAMVLYAGLVCVVLIAAPKRDASPADQAGTLLLLAGTLAVYSTDNLLVLLAGWIVSILPLWERPKDSTASWFLPRFMLGVSTVALGVAIVLIGMEAQGAGVAHPYSLAALQGVKVIDNQAVYALSLIHI